MEILDQQVQAHTRMISMRMDIYMTDGTIQESNQAPVLSLNNDGTVAYGTPMTTEALANLAKLAETTPDGQSLVLVFLCNEILKLRLELNELKTALRFPSK